MAKNEIETWLLERAEHVIVKEQLENQVATLEDRFTFEKDAVENLISLKHQVIHMD